MLGRRSEDWLTSGTHAAQSKQDLGADLQEKETQALVKKPTYESKEKANESPLEK